MCGCDEIRCRVQQAAAGRTVPVPVKRHRGEPHHGHDTRAHLTRTGGSRDTRDDLWSWVAAGRARVTTTQGPPRGPAGRCVSRPGAPRRLPGVHENWFFAAWFRTGGTGNPKQKTTVNAHSRPDPPKHVGAANQLSLIVSHGPEAWPTGDTVWYFKLATGSPAPRYMCVTSDPRCVNDDFWRARISRLSATKPSRPRLTRCAL